MIKFLKSTVTPTSEIERKIAAEQCRMLYQNLPFNSIFHVSASFILCSILWTEGNRQHLLWWWALVAILSLFRLGSYFFYRNSLANYSVRFWNLIFGCGSLLIGFLWGLAGVYLTPHQILSYELFVGFVIAGMVVGAVPVLSSVRSVYLAFAFAAELPYISHVLTHPGDIYVAVAVIHGLFLLLILLMTTRMYKLIRESLLLRFYNIDLVEKLQESNEQLQAENEVRNQNMKQIAESEDKYRTLADAAHEGIIMHKQGIIIDANRYMAHMFGYSIAELVGMHVNELLTEESKAIVAQKIAIPDTESFEVVGKTRQGKHLDLEINGQYISYQGEKVRLVTVRDITHYKELVEIQSLARQKAEEADRSKTEFLAAVSHELRTPLNAVMGFTQLLQDTPLAEEQKEYLDMTYRSGEQLLSLINDLLDLSRIESGHLELEIISYDLRDELNHILELLSLKLTESSNIIKLEFADDLPKMVKGDPLRLRQVMLNLLGNAIKFTEEGAIEFSVSRTNDQLCFMVKDYGKGIPEDKLDYIFGKFNQVDSSASREHGGAGLGLAICKLLVEAMGGEISVTSKLGVGTSFRVDLPIEVNTESTQVLASETATEEWHMPMPRKRILLVEDDKTNQLIAIALLEKFGHQVSVAENGQQAIEMLHENNDYDLLFMDIQMPVMDGITATQKLREQGVNLPIIAMTANAMAGDRETYIKAGMDDYISKPIYEEGLQLVLQKYV